MQLKYILYMNKKKKEIIQNKTKLNPNKKNMLSNFFSFLASTNFSCFHIF